MNTIGQTVPDPVITARTGLVLRMSSVRIPLWLWLLGKVAKGVGLLMWFCVRHWWLTVPLAATGYLWWRHSWIAALLAWLGAIGAALFWWRHHEASFTRWLAYPLRSKVRRWVLQRRFAQTMVAAGLAMRFDGHVLLPVMRRVRCGRWVDLVTVRMLAGQIVDDYSKAALTLATSFAALDVKVQPGRRAGEVVLGLLRRDPLARVVPPIPVVASPDLRALPIGVMEQGDPFTLCLLGNQVLGVGATGSGKASLAWSFIRALAGAVSSGHVRLWVFDPKGGMELAAGRSMFDRFLCEDYPAMAEILDQAVVQMRARTERLRGVTRQHEPTAREPLTVIVIDELAALTAYADKQIRDRIKQSLGMILTQGRAVGFHVLALVQDPRKEVLPFRDLFTVRIGLRLNEPQQVDMVLGDGARDRGAACDRIPQTLPGAGYVVLDGDPTPVRVRLAYLDDGDIADMAATYGRPSVINGHWVPTQPDRDHKPSPASRPASEWVVNR